MNRVFLPFIFCLGLIPSLSFGQEVENTNLQKEATPYEKANSEYLLIDAEKHLLLEDYDKAMALLDQAIEVDKQNHAAYLKRSEVFVLKESFDEAISEIEKAITIKPNNIYYYVWAVQLYQQNKDREKIAATYALMLANCSGYEKYGVEIVDAFAIVGKNSEALQLITELKEYYPNYSELYLKQAEIELTEGKTKRSIETIALAQSLFPYDPTILVLHVKNLTAQNKNEEAIALLEGLDGSLLEGQLMLIETYIANGNLKRANNLATQLILNDESTMESRLLIMSYLLNSKDSYLMLDSLQQQFESQYSDSPIVFENGGLLYSQMSKNSNEEQRIIYARKAIRSYKNLALLDPNNFDTWIKIFEYEILQAQWSDLLHDVEYLIDLYPNQSILFYYYSEAYRGLADFGEAFDLINQGLKMSGRNELLKSLLTAQKGRILVDQGDQNRADQAFNQALSTDHVDERAIYFYANWLAEVNPEAAKELMQVFSTRISESSKWHFIEIKTAYYEGQVQHAKTEIENLITAQPNNMQGNILELYGDILFQQGSTEEALLQWKKALNLGGFSQRLKDKIANKAYN